MTTRGDESALSAQSCTAACAYLSALPLFAGLYWQRGVPEVPGMCDRASVRITRRLITSSRTFSQDVSSGALIAEHPTRMGACDVMRHNPWNAVVCCGHSNGIVTMWTPNLSTPVVKMLTHRGPVTALAVDAGGRYPCDCRHGLETQGAYAAGRSSRLCADPHPTHTKSPLGVGHPCLPVRTGAQLLLTNAGQLATSARPGLCAVGFSSHVQVRGPPPTSPRRRRVWRAR